MEDMQRRIARNDIDAERRDAIKVRLCDSYRVCSVVLIQSPGHV